MSSSDRAAGRRFLSVAVAVAALGLAAMAATAALTDPFGLLAARGWGPGRCAPGIKVRDDRYLAVVLPLARPPDEIAVGSSRVIWGFRRASFAARTPGTVLNLAMSSASLADMDAVTRAAVEAAPVRRVWIGLDFGAFARPDASPPPWRDRLGPVREPGMAALRYGLFDGRALRAGLTAAMAPAACADPPFDVFGFASAAVPGGNPQRLTAVEPDARVRRLMLRAWRMPDADRERLYRAELARLDALLADLRRREVTAVVYLSPSHPAFHALVAEAGLAPWLRRWRGDVRRVAQRRGAVFIAADSEAFMARTEAPACPAGAAKADCDFYDATHFRPHVGDAIVAAGLRGSGRP